MIENPILKFNQVCFSYPERSNLVLSQFSLEFSRGRVTAILGPNGTGKTTMLMLALGWLVPDSGKIWFGEKLLSEFSRSELGQRIALVPQFEPSFFDFSLLDFVLLGRAPYLGSFSVPGPPDYAIARSALEKVGMADKADASVMQISGGEHQLVLLARALTQQTDLLMLDEPTSHLDIKNKSKLIGILRELVKDGKTIVFTTHEPDVAAMIADQVVMVRMGQVAYTGRVEEVMTGNNL
ncbi:MAG: ABC transporter ATP-binding protein, partial [Candidatus Rifleibacteriota bacterium]